VILDKRRWVTDSYQHMLAPIVDDFGLQLPVVPTDRAPAFHMFYVLLPDRFMRDAVLDSMRARGVQPTFHYVPLHSAPGAERFAAHPTECPVTDDISGRLLRLPFHNNLTIEQIDRVVDTFHESLVEARAETRR
jgi:dTDP-4-amino-4,6-dideoxygalactose transaminase